LVGGAQYRIGVDVPGERMIQATVAPNNGISHCHYGTTFLHNLGRYLPSTIFDKEREVNPACLHIRNVTGSRRSVLS
jgi:hypothetical protein